MLIVSKDRKAVVNMDNTLKIFIGSDNTSIKVDCVDGRGTQLGKYDTITDCEIAMEMIIKRLSGQMVYVPTEKEIQAHVAHEDKTNIHSAGNGKKVVRRGGS